jgi:hypothetical protein
MSREATAPGFFPAIKVIDAGDGSHFFEPDDFVDINMRGQDRRRALITFRDNKSPSSRTTTIDDYEKKKERSDLSRTSSRIVGVAVSRDA